MAGEAAMGKPSSSTAPGMRVTRKGHGEWREPRSRGGCEQGHCPGGWRAWDRGSQTAFLSSCGPLFLQLVLKKEGELNYQVASQLLPLPCAPFGLFLCKRFLRSSFIMSLLDLRGSPCGPRCPAAEALLLTSKGSGSLL